MQNSTSNSHAHYAFASDNCAGLCPEVLESLNAASSDYAPSYGEDSWTRKATELIREFFECDCDVFMVFNGTAANSLALSAMVRSYQSVLCHRHSHVQTDECGCPEMLTGGSKLLNCNEHLGKIDLRHAREIATYERGVHFPPARAMTITQATELGTLYSPQEMQEVGAFCREHHLHLHVDGARFANAIAGLNCHPSEVTWKCGVDCMTLGGTKNGMAVGECVVFFNRELANEFAFRIKQGGQLASKMRYLSAPWVGMLQDGAYVRRAADANRAAQKLASGLQAALAHVHEFELEYPVEANAVFARFPTGWNEKLHDIGWHFYDLIGNGQSRLMCSWATTDDEIDAFIADCKSVATNTM